VCSRHDDVCVFEGVFEYPSGDWTTDVADVSMEDGSNIIADLTEFLIIEISWVCGESSNDELGLEFLSLSMELVIVDELGGLVACVLFPLPEPGSCGDLSLLGLEAMRQVTTFGKGHAHESITWWNKGGVDCEVGRAT